MADLVEALKQKFFDADGEPLVGGKLYAFQAGTTTPLVTYANQDESTENEHPIILDANGEADVWVGPNAYKFVLTDADDAVLWTVDNVSHLSPESISTLMLQDRSVTTIKLALDAVETENIKDLEVTTGKLAAGAVTTAKITDANVTTAKIADLNVTAAKLAANAVETAKILDANVTAAKLAANAVETAKILDANVTTGKLADLAVTDAKCATRSITAVKLATAFGAQSFTASSTTSSTFTTIATAVATFTDTASNRPLQFFVRPAYAGTANYFSPPPSSTAGAYMQVRIRISGTTVALWEFGPLSGTAARIPMSICNTIDQSSGSIGSNTYTLEVASSNNSSTVAWTAGVFIVTQL